MKKIILALSIIVLLTGCSGKEAANQSMNNDAAAGPVTGIQEEKGYGDVSKIEIRKFTYNGKKIIQNRELNKLVILEKGQDIKKAADIFNSKVKNAGIFDRLASDYQMDVIKKDGSRESHDMSIGESAIYFFDNKGGFYQVNNTDSVKVMLGLMQTVYNEPLDEAGAVSLIVKERPDFPSNPKDVITKKLPTGGEQGATANVKFTTTVKKAAKSTYTVTLIKDWGITVNGKYAKSSWKYEVTSNSVRLIECTNNDYLPNTMK